MGKPVNTAQPSHYAAIFCSQRTDEDEAGYREMATRMMELAAMQPGFLGADSARDASGFGITVSYWRDEASIKAWKAQGEHREAQRLGREKWYSFFSLQIAKVERSFAFDAAAKGASAED